MAENTIAKAYVQLIPSTKGIKNTIEKEFGVEASNASSSFGKIFGSKLKSALIGIGTSAGALLTTSIFNGAKLEQNLGGAEVVFGEFADSIKNKANEAYKEMGLSASDYMATANKMASLFQGSGLEQVKAMELSTKAMQRASDVASILGIDLSMAMESIAGAAKGNFTMMDNLGVAMNATTLEAYALEKGLNFKWNIASNAEKAELAMEMFFDRTSQYAGNFKKESEETLQGSLDAMKSSFANFMGNLSLGENIKPSLEALVSTTKTFLVGNLLPMIGNVIKAIPEIIVEIGPGIIEKGKEIINNLADGFVEGFPLMLSNVLVLAQNIGTWLASKAPLFIQKGFEILSKLVAGIVNAIPVLIEKLPLVISTFANIINDNFPTILKNGFDLLVQFVTGILSAIPTLISNIPQIISAIVDTILAFNWLNLGKNIIDFFGNGIKSMINFIRTNTNDIATNIVNVINTLPSKLYQLGQSAVGDIGNAFSSMITWIKGKAAEIVTGIVGKIGELPGSLFEIGENMIKGLWDGVSNMYGWIIDKIGGFASSIIDNVKGFFGIHSPSRVFAEIGKMNMLGLADGIAKNSGLVEDEMNKIGKSMAGTKLMNALKNDSVKLAYSTNNVPNYGDNSGYNQVINVYSPQALNPSEVARQTRNATRQMALSLSLGR